MALQDFSNQLEKEVEFTEMNKAPIAVMAFNRTDYLTQTLETLAGQHKESLSNREIHLFQDGVVNPISRKRYGADAVCVQNTAVFTKLFPAGVIHAQEENLGIARHFDFIEKYFFEERQFEAALFFEDDMILSPDYVSVMDLLIKQALERTRIGYVAAYGDHHASLQDQMANLPKIIEMRHKWGFALMRRQWLRQRPFVQEYLDLISDQDYQMRDGRKIVEWLVSKKLVPGGTSQDGIKDVAMYQSGAAKLMSYCCYGKYIGKTGVHSTEKIYSAEGFASTQICPSVASDFAWLTDDELDRMINARRQAFADNVNKVNEIFPFFAKRSTH